MDELRGPGHFLFGAAAHQRGRVAMGAVYGSTWLVSLALTPFLLSHAIDRGLRPHRLGTLLAWAAAMLVLGCANATLGILRHRTMTRIRLEAGLRTAEKVLGQSTRLGAALPRRITAGEVVTIGIGDVWVVARAMASVALCVAGVATYAVVAVLLVRISPLIAVLVLAGVPVIAVVMGPQLRRLQAAGGRYRERQGALAARLVDILGGLRILNGLGGKRAHAQRYARESAALQAEGYRVGGVASWIEGLGAGLPTVFLAVVTWVAARLAARGGLSVGELIAVYGYVAVLAIPVGIFIETGTDLTRGLVSARRIVAYLQLPAEQDGPDAVAGPSGPATLHDPVSGVSLEPGRLTVLAGARPADAVLVIDRLGGYGETPATWGGRRLDGIRRAEVRERILVADHAAELFAGELREVIAGREDLGDEAVRAAIETAVAADVADDLAAPLERGGRNLSGGQRQRVRLARAVLADREMLLAAEPTSAVDAHTETAIAERLAVARAGKATLIATTSPVLLDRADVVHYLVDGRVAASGGHRELLAAHPGYRALVTRGEQA